MGKIVWRVALKTIPWVSILLFGYTVYRYLSAPKATGIGISNDSTIYVLTLLFLGVITGFTLALNSKLFIGKPIPTNYLNQEKLVEEKFIYDDAISYQQLIEREIWKHENIRGWISYELHEDIGQILIAARNHLQASHLQNLSMPPQIEFARDILEEAIHKVRKLTEKLEVPPLELLGLIPCLQQKVEEANNIGFTEIILQNSTSSFEFIEETSKLMIYRIIAEKLNNIDKHSKAKKAWITLELAAPNIILNIKDNGIGFYNSERVWRNGFNLIKTMITAMEGTFEIKSAPGRGCEFSAIIPCKKKVYAKEQFADLNHSTSAYRHS